MARVVTAGHLLRTGHRETLSFLENLSPDVGKLLDKRNAFQHMDQAKQPNWSKSVSSDFLDRDLKGIGREASPVA